MELPVNAFKRALKAGKIQIGLWCSLSSHYATELVAGSGFDWILLDTEHSPNDLESVLTQLQAAAPYPTHAVVRVPWNDMVTIKRFLDIGAQSILIPYVQNAEEARNAVAYTRYPPAGVRGVAGGTRATRFARVKDFIGPADLHASLGYTGETNNPKMMPIIDDAIRRIRKAGKAPGILTGVEADARRWLECGGLFVAVGADTGVLARETEKLAAKFKS
jgi:4-hydroxy-2-oxoheptanedioate aldolase